MKETTALIALTVNIFGFGAALVHDLSQFQFDRRPSDLMLSSSEDLLRIKHNRRSGRNVNSNLEPTELTNPMTQYCVA